jgi:hypothetical protein
MGYYTLPPIDRKRYTDIKGLEGPFVMNSGKVLYYDPKEGKYYDRDTDFYVSNEDMLHHNKLSPELYTEEGNHDNV